MVNLTIDGRRISVPAGDHRARGGQVARHPHPDHVPRAGNRAGLVVLPLRGADRRPPHALARLRHARRGGHGGGHRQRGRPRGAQDGAGTSALRSRRRVRRAVRGPVPGRARHSGVRVRHRDGGHIAARWRSSPTGSRCPVRWGASARVCASGNAAAADLDQGLAIGALHRYVADLDGGALRCRRARHPPGSRWPSWARGPRAWPPLTISLQNGHDCTLFDAHPLPGGMLRYGIPAYRLPKDALDAEIDAIRRLGARFRMGERWGEHFTLAGLRAAARRGVRGHRGAARPGAPLRRRGTRAGGHRVSGARGQRESAAVGQRCRGGRRRQYRHGLRPLRGPAGRTERAGPLSPQPAGDALPDGGGGGRRSRRRAHRPAGRAGAAGTKRRKPVADLPADDAGRTRRLGAPPAGGGGWLRFHHRVLHRDRGHRAIGGALAGRAGRTRGDRLGHRRR